MKGRAAIRVSDYRSEDAGIVIRMWPAPSTRAKRATFPTLEAAVQYLEMALPIGLWGANIPDIFKEPE